MGDSKEIPEVRCNDCNWEGVDEDLVRQIAIDEPTELPGDCCPACGCIQNLMDLDPL